MPTVCIDCRYVGEKPSGIGTVVSALADCCPALAPAWTFLLLRHPTRRAPLSTSPNVREITLAAGSNGPASMWWLPRLVDLDGVDLFHAPANILPHGLSMPCVTTIHDTMWLTAPDLCNARPWGKIERLFYRHGMRRALERSHAIVTVSEATRSDVLELRPELMDGSFACLPAASTEFRPQPVCEQDLASLGLANRRFVLTVGQDAPYKNHDQALRAFAGAFADDPEMALVLLQRRGRGAQRLGGLARALGIKRQVLFLSGVTEARLRNLYCAALALLHPSLHEGFGMPLAEAMACGCAVITSDRSAMPEVAGGAALLVDPHNTDAIARALRSIAESSDIASDLRERGRRRALAFDRRSFAKGNLDVYRSVLGVI